MQSESKGKDKGESKSAAYLAADRWRSRTGFTGTSPVARESVLRSRSLAKGALQSGPVGFANSFALPVSISSPHAS